MIKYIKQFNINYWFNKGLDIDFYWWINDNDTNQKQLKLTIWRVHKLPEFDEENWYSNWCKHIVLWKSK